MDLFAKAGGYILAFLVHAGLYYWMIEGFFGLIRTRREQIARCKRRADRITERRYTLLKRALEKRLLSEREDVSHCS